MGYRRLVLLTMGSLLGSVVFGQDCDACRESGPVRMLDKDSAKKYIAGYDAAFRRSQSSQDLHPQSILFSRLAFEEFYRVNFQEKPGKYSGMNLCLVSFGRTRAEGQRHVDQISIVMAPRGQDCRIDSSGFLVANNAFDNRMSAGSQGVQYMTRKEFREAGQRYEARFRADPQGKRHYTRSMFLGTAVCDKIAAYFRATPDADGLAIHPAVYGSMQKICGLNDPGQITFVLVPLVGGVPGYSDYKTFIGPNSSGMNSSLILNHGSLCPDICY